MRRLALVLGAGLATYGAYELVVGVPWSQLSSAFTWFAGGVVLHDVLLVPLTLLLGVILVRVVPGGYRGLVQGAVVVSAMVTVAMLPLLSGRGQTPANPSQQPLPYARNVLLVLLGLWLVTGVLALLRARRRRSRPEPTRA